MKNNYVKNNSEQIKFKDFHFRVSKLMLKMPQSGNDHDQIVFFTVCD